MLALWRAAPSQALLRLPGQPTKWKASGKTRSGWKIYSLSPSPLFLPPVPHDLGGCPLKCKAPWGLLSSPGQCLTLTGVVLGTATPKVPCFWENGLAANHALFTRGCSDHQMLSIICSMHHCQQQQMQLWAVPTDLRTTTLAMMTYMFPVPRLASLSETRTEQFWMEWREPISVKPQQPVFDSTLPASLSLPQIPYMTPALLFQHPVRIRTTGGSENFSSTLPMTLSLTQPLWTTPICLPQHRACMHTSCVCTVCWDRRAGVVCGCWVCIGESAERHRQGGVGAKDKLLFCAGGAAEYGHFVLSFPHPSSATQARHDRNLCCQGTREDLGSILPTMLLLTQPLCMTPAQLLLPQCTMHRTRTRICPLKRVVSLQLHNAIGSKYSKEA